DSGPALLHQRDCQRRARSDDGALGHVGLAVRRLIGTKSYSPLVAATGELTLAIRAWSQSVSIIRLRSFETAHTTSLIPPLSSSRPLAARTPRGGGTGCWSCWSWRAHRSGGRAARGGPKGTDGPGVTLKVRQDPILFARDHGDEPAGAKT